MATVPMLYALADGLTIHGRTLADEYSDLVEVTYISEEVLAAARMLRLIADNIEKGTWL